MDTKQRIVAARQQMASLETQRTELTERLAEIRTEVEAALIEWLPAWFDECARQEVQTNHESAQAAGVEALSSLKERITTLESEARAIVSDHLAEVDWPHVTGTIEPGVGPWSIPQGPGAYESRTVSNQLPAAIAHSVLGMCARIGPPLVAAGVTEPVKDEPGHGGAPWRKQVDGALRFYDSPSGRGPTAEVPQAVQRLTTEYVETLKKVRDSRQNHRETVRELEQAEALLLFDEA